MWHKMEFIQMSLAQGLSTMPPISIPIYCLVSGVLRPPSRAAPAVATAQQSKSQAPFSCSAQEDLVSFLNAL